MSRNNTPLILLFDRKGNAIWFDPRKLKGINETVRQCIAHRKAHKHDNFSLIAMIDLNSGQVWADEVEDGKAKIYCSPYIHKIPTTLARRPDERETIYLRRCINEFIECLAQEDLWCRYHKFARFDPENYFAVSADELDKEDEFWNPEPDQKSGWK